MTSRRPGRPSKYQWDDKRDICYKLYVEEGKSIKDVLNYFRETYGSHASLPRARDCSRQFSRWRFPSHRTTLSDDEEARLASRVRELYDANYDQQQMLETLVSDGWQLDVTSLSRVRRKHGLMLRLAKGYDREHMGPGSGKKRKHVDVTSTLEHALTVDDTSLDPQEAARRAQRLTTLQIESDAALSSRKRRRRIRGLANLPPDAPGMPPRYKSETSLDECKSFLGLANDVYKDIRKHFESICNEMNIIKKRLCNEGDWMAAKQRLIKENISLLAALNPVHEDISERENALEVICSDVTKRMRNQRTRISVKDANTTLGLNPAASKELRRQFYDILKADQFETKLLCGDDHWNELKQQWVQSSDLAQQLYSATSMDEQGRKCIEVLLRDAMKRHHDNNVSKIPHLTQRASSTITVSPIPRPGPVAVPVAVPAAALARAASVVPRSSFPSTPTVQHSVEIDPALYEALSTELVAATPAPTIPAFFRLSADSTIEHSKLWLASLPTQTMQALTTAALSRSKQARLVKVSGILRSATGQEEVYQIDSDEELEAYLESAHNTDGGKASFVVILH